MQGSLTLSYLKPAPLKNAPRPILRQLNNGPVATKLDRPAAFDGPQQTGTGGTVERTMPAGRYMAKDMFDADGGPITGARPSRRRAMRRSTAIVSIGLATLTVGLGLSGHI